MGKRAGSFFVQSGGMEQPASDAVVGVISEEPGQPPVVYRMAGDTYLLVEYGEMVLDLNLRFRVQRKEERQ